MRRRLAKLADSAGSGTLRDSLQLHFHLQFSVERYGRVSRKSENAVPQGEEIKCNHK